MRLKIFPGLALVCAIGFSTTANAAPILGQVDDFEDGTTQGWVINLLGMGSPPPATLPQNIATGGPAGVDDNFLQLTSIGGNVAGGRLTAANPFGQWAGDYLASGITVISMDVRNLGTSDLELRLLFEDPTFMTGPANIAVSTDSIFLAAGGGWQSVLFPIVPSALTAVLGNVNDVLSNTTVVRIFHSPTAAFPVSRRMSGSLWPWVYAYPL